MSIAAPAAQRSAVQLHALGGHLTLRGNGYLPLTPFAEPRELAHAAFDAYVAGDSRRLREMTHPDAARQYQANAVKYVAEWLRLGQIQRAVESGALTPETVSSFRFDENAPVDDAPIFHLPGVRTFGEITRLDPEDFLERAFTGAAKLFGYPSRPGDLWQRDERFELRGAVTLQGDVARVAYRHTEIESDGPDSTRDGELVAKMFEGYWRLWFDRELFPPLSLFLHE